MSGRPFFRITLKVGADNCLMEGVYAHCGGKIFAGGFDLRNSKSIPAARGTTAETGVRTRST
jgi:hypothetical protein